VARSLSLKYTARRPRLALGWVTTIRPDAENRDLFIGMDLSLQPIVYIAVIVLARCYINVLLLLLLL